uniref:hypothetical protein n=1 Tax=Nonomuraea lactucae TaxID=2249762 RepID=UPI0013B35DC6
MSVRVNRRAALAGLLSLALACADAPVGVTAPWPGQTRVARGARSLVLGHRDAPGLLHDLARRADT